MLINCPECGKKISDKTTKCTHCGYPLKNEKDKENNPQEKSQNTKRTILG